MLSYALHVTPAAMQMGILNPPDMAKVYPFICTLLLRTQQVCGSMQAVLALYRLLSFLCVMCMVCLVVLYGTRVGFLLGLCATPCQ
jgi:hypothetical protein